MWSYNKNLMVISDKLRAETGIQTDDDTEVERN